MENINKTPATQESVWEAFRETDRLIKELRAERAEELAKNAEAEAKYQREREEMLAKYAEDGAKYQREREEMLAKNAEADAKYQRERAESNADFDRRIKKLEELTGGIANNQGHFAEEYFFNAFEKGKRNFFGEKFDRINRNVKGIKPKYEDEYDILMINGTSVGIVETKYKAHLNNISNIIKKAETFRANFPDFANHNIYIALASMMFYPEIENKCINEGIAVIKQVGDTVVINDKSLKVF